jgi:hypothetical protein|tara:strand:- start:1054 stop:1740 length:687 start_codon:yes stop_codon:yes gene_type:complete
MSYLADVEMPQKEVEEELEVVNLDSNETFAQATQDESEVMMEDEGVEEEPSPIPPPPEKKDKLKSEDIFKPKAPPKKVTIADNVSEYEPIVPKIAPVKKKRELSEKQKEALAKGRAKRAANKKAQSAQPARPATPAPDNPSGAGSNGVAEPVAPAPAPPPPMKPQMYSKEDLSELVFQGVQKYDSMRKERKAKKREAQAKQTHDNQVFGAINSALNRNNDPWASAFNF